MTLVLFLGILFSLGAPGHVLAASGLRWFGNDARNAAMGNGGYAIGTGLGNLLINPANMSYSPGGAWISFSAAPSWLEIRPKPRSPAWDIPTYLDDAADPAGRNAEPSSVPGWEDRPAATDTLKHQRSNTNNLDTTYLLSMGAIESFGIPGFRVGLGATIPLPSMVGFNAWYNDEREQHFSNRLHFERFGEFDSVLAIYPGLSYSPIEWVSIGLSLRMDLLMDMETGLYMPDGTNFSYAYVSPEGGVKATVRPIAGLSFKAPFGLRFGAVYRHETYMDIDLKIDTRVYGVRQAPDGDEQIFFPQTHKYIVGYEPTEVTLAAAYEYKTFSVEASGAWQRWSVYQDRYANNSLHPAWLEPDPESGEETLNWKDPKFNDVFVFRAGGEVWLARFAAIRVGFGYYPSPFPEQTGRYNYVDNDLFLYSLGAGFRFELLGKTMTVDLAAQIWQMKSLQVYKAPFGEIPVAQGGVIDELPDDLQDQTLAPFQGAEGFQTNNPGYPGYALDGVVLNLALMLGMEFGG